MLHPLFSNGWSVDGPKPQIFGRGTHHILVLLCSIHLLLLVWMQSNFGVAVILPFIYYAPSRCNICQLKSGVVMLLPHIISGLFRE